MELYEEFFRIVQALESGHVPYAVVGGIAMGFHDRPRFTRDIDLLKRLQGEQDRKDDPGNQ